jgi:hypothetical protein
MKARPYFASVLLLASCGEPSGPAPGEPIALLEIHALDLWGQPLPSTAALSVTAGGALAIEAGPSDDRAHGATSLAASCRDGYEPLAADVKTTETASTH